MKSGLCKYYQPLRLEKPSNFRLNARLITLAATLMLFMLTIGVAGILATRESNAR
jgi:hypothetical protein